MSIQRFQTSQYVDFKVMGLDNHSSDFLNWCLKERDNLEFIRQCKTLEKPSSSFTGHLDHLKIIQRIDDALCHKR